MKAIRSRDEAFTQLKNKRSQVHSKMTKMDSKLREMNRRGEDLVNQTYKLDLIKEELRTLDGELTAETTELPSFKRRIARQWMSLKFGGLAECAKKGVVGLLSCPG